VPQIKELMDIQQTQYNNLLHSNGFDNQLLSAPNNQGAKVSGSSREAALKWANDPVNANNPKLNGVKAKLGIK
jgi:hypothetical protein